MSLKDGMKIIPSLITVANLVLGLVALVLAYDGYIATAAMMVLIGMVLDAFDGRIARLIGCESAFGKELDSLSDIVTFGVAPAFIMYVSVLRDAGWLGMLAAIVFPLCGALRLARFNVQTTSSKYFVGLPITAAGGILATLALYRNDLTPAAVVIPLCMCFLALLMVSNARYPNFKRIRFPRSAVIGVPALSLFIYLAYRFDRAAANRLVLVPLALYALYGALRWFRRRSIVAREAKRDTEQTN